MGWIGDSIEKAGGAVKDGFKGAKAAITDGANYVSDKIKAGAKSAGKGAKWVADKVKEGGKAALDGAVYTADKIGEAEGKVIGRTTSAFTSNFKPSWGLIAAIGFGTYAFASGII